MRTPRLYLDESLETNRRYTLDKSTSSYLLKVLRHPINGPLTVFNGLAFNGSTGYFQAHLVSTGKQAEIHTDAFVIDDKESAFKLSLYQGVSKGDHMDTTIQKAVELGASELIPVICERTVVNLKADRLEKKLRHWQKIVINACEQCGRNQLMTIHPPIKLSDISLTTDSSAFMLSPTANNSFNFNNTLQNASILIGPEGGFDEQEILTAEAKGFSPIRFGPRILRTETAAIAALSILQSYYGDLN